MKLSTKQIQSVKESTSRINIWDGSVRSGKTWVSCYRWVKYLITKEAPLGGELFIVGKTQSSAYRNLIKPMQFMFGANNITYNNANKCTIFGVDTTVLGANDERAEGKIRGVTSSGFLGDELTLWDQRFFKMALSRLSLDGSKFFGTTNPDSPYHSLKVDFLDRKDELDLAHFHFEIDDSPFLTREYIDNIKKEYTGLWYKRFIEGLWVAAEGAVYDFFGNRCILKKKPKAQFYVVGADYGTNNPTCFILFGVNRNTKPAIWAEREFYYDASKTRIQKTDKEYSLAMRKFLRWDEISGKVVPRYIILDPSAASFKIQLMKDGFRGIKPANNDVLDGIRTQANMLKNGDYAVYKDCSQTIKDYSAYSWDIKSQLKGIDAPIKQNDHTKDTERYVLQTLYGDKTIDYGAYSEW